VETLRGIRALVVDLEGTLYVGDEALPGVKEALASLRAAEIPVRFLTNTTSRPRRAIVDKLERMGLDIEEESILTAPRAAAEIFRRRGVSRAHFLLKEPVLADFEGIEAAHDRVQAVVVGDLGDGFTSERLNHAFRLLLEGAEFYALAENRMYRHGDGLCLDVGAFVRALEYGSRREAILLGKPSRLFFESAAAGWDFLPTEIASIGDDLDGDVAGGQGVGFKGVLVRTGKFREGDLRASEIHPDAVIDSFANIPALLDLG
jgi:HAD superfamily hydrolase (TIGR01458 family)